MPGVGATTLQRPTITPIRFITAIPILLLCYAVYPAGVYWGRRSIITRTPLASSLALSGRRGVIGSGGPIHDADFWHGAEAVQKWSSRTTSGRENTRTMIDVGNSSGSSVRVSATGRGASSGSPTSLEFPLEAGDRVQVQRDPYQAVGLILFGENPRENVEAPCAVIDRDRKVAVRRAGSGCDCLAQALDRRQRIDRAAAEGFGKRRLAAGVVRAALGHDRIATGDKSHADAIVAPLAQIKKGVVARRLCRPVGDDSPGGARGSVENG